MSTPEGWYPDPSNAIQQRRWDGSTWTHEVRPLPPPDLPPPNFPPPQQVPASTPAPPSAPPGPATGASIRSAATQAIGATIGHDGSDVYKISEEGKNGTVEFGDKGLDRVLKKTLGKDDRQFVPYSSISMVSHDRKRVGRDIVVVQVGTKSYDWKIVADAEGFVNRLNELIA